MVTSENMREQRNGSRRPETSEAGGSGEHAQGTSAGNRQEVAERRVLRFRYLEVKNMISDKREDISSIDSDNFKSIISEVESLHELVQKPREQVADAGALLDIASTLATSVKCQVNEGVSPSDFITAVLKNFGEQNGMANFGNSETIFRWSDFGHAVANVFRNATGCCTMIGPMYSELKQRKAVVQRKRTRSTESTQPEEVYSGTEVKTDTDKNMSTMFDILRRKKNAKLEHLLLNRESFAQTVENIFALSFLVKDGRAEITVNASGHHIVSPRNAPTTSAVASGQVSYDHFVFRFDFTDWKLMVENVAVGEELMPHRMIASASNSMNGGAEAAAAPATPIRKLCRNRGLVIQEESVVEDSPETDACASNHKRKHLFR